MLPAQVNNQGYKQPQAFEESAAPTRYDKQIHQKDIPDVRVSLQGESEWAEGKSCSSHTPTHVPCHPEITKLCSHCWSSCPSHAILCRLSLAFGTGTTQRLQKNIREGAKQGHYRAMSGTDLLLSWCYMNTVPICSRRKLSTQTSTGSVQSRQNCQQHSACGTSNLFRNWTQLVFPQLRLFADLPPIDFPHRAVPGHTPTVFWAWSTQFT